MTLDMMPEGNERQKLLLAPDNYEVFDLNVRKGFHHQYMRNMLHINNGDGSDVSIVAWNCDVAMVSLAVDGGLAVRSIGRVTCGQVIMLWQASLSFLGEVVTSIVIVVVRMVVDVVMLAVVVFICS